MIDDPRPQATGNFHSRPPWPEIARRYPSITAADGRVFFIDRHGIIDGLSPYECDKGGRRCDCPTDAPDQEQIAWVMLWIERRSLEPIRTPSMGSYHLKHVCERWAGDYISNGALIIAFHRCGFRQFADASTLGLRNTNICVSRKSVRQLPESSPSWRMSTSWREVGAR